MNNIKKITIAFLVALIIVVIVEVVWNKFGKQEVTVYLATKEIYKGEKILQGDVKEISVNNSKSIKEYAKDDIVGKIAKENIASRKDYIKRRCYFKKIKDR